MADLTEGERRLLALERVWADVPGADINGPAATPEYRRLVAELTEREQAEGYAPIITRVLRRKRYERERPVPRTPRAWFTGAASAVLAGGAGAVAADFMLATSTPLFPVLLLL